MTNTRWTKEQVNEAIYTVLTTQFKKQAPEAFEIVKAAGYEYDKYNGRFNVYNGKTNRRISLDDGGWYKNYWLTVNHGYYTANTTTYRGELEDLLAKVKRFDFVGCLDKPMNREYYAMLHDADDNSQAVQKWQSLKYKKNCVQWRVEEIERIQLQMEKLQKDLMRAMERKVEYEQDVINYKKELGLA